MSAKTTIIRGDGTDSLPAAGDAQRDTLKARADDLAEAVANTPGLSDVGAIDPAKLEVEREIAVEIVEHNRLAVTNAQTGYRYAWIRAFTKDGRPDMAPVFEKQSIRVRVNGGDLVPAWEVVNGTHDPEAKENMDVHGYRRIGDVILMRCREEIYDALSLDEQRRAAEFVAKHEANIDDMIEQSGAKGVITRSSTGGMRPRDWARARAEFARQGATHIFDKMLREGTIPNLPPARVAR